MRRIVALILLSVLPISASWAAYTLKYNSMRVGQEDGVVRVVVDLNGPSAMKYFSLSKPDRFVVDLSGVIRTGKMPALDFANTPVSAVRAGIRNGNDLRLVLELSDRKSVV